MSEIAFEFQHAIVEVLVTKLFRAAQQTGIRTLMLAG
jgi:tRNA A37 threonylcarbamoyltransferase TsaD